jgi:hypothetical protein
MHNDELYNLQSSGTKFEGKKSLGKYRSRWEDNFKTDLKEVGWEGVDWSYFTQDGVQWRVVVSQATKFRFS